jgi:antitoxin PrlF
MIATVTAEGVVTLPKSVRDQLGLEKGGRVDFREGADGSFALVRAEEARPSESRFSRLRGHAGPGATTDEIMSMTRGED